MAKDHRIFLALSTCEWLGERYSPFNLISDVLTIVEPSPQLLHSGNHTTLSIL